MVLAKSGTKLKALEREVLGSLFHFLLLVSLFDIIYSSNCVQMKLLIKLQFLHKQYFRTKTYKLLRLFLNVVGMSWDWGVRNLFHRKFSLCYLLLLIDFGLYYASSPLCFSANFFCLLLRGWSQIGLHVLISFLGYPPP